MMCTVLKVMLIFAVHDSIFENTVNLELNKLIRNNSDLC